MTTPQPDLPDPGEVERPRPDPDYPDPGRPENYHKSMRYDLGLDPEPRELRMEAGRLTMVRKNAAGDIDYDYVLLGAARPPSGFAIVSLVLGLVGGAILAVIFGHVALSEIKRTGKDGKGMAIAGLVLGYIETVFWVLLFVVFVGVIGSTA